MKRFGLALLCTFVLFCTFALVTLAQNTSSPTPSSSAPPLSQSVPSEDSGAGETPSQTEEAEQSTQEETTDEATSEENAAEENTVEGSSEDLPIAKRSMKISRKDRDIKVTNNAPDERGGEFRLNIPECEKDTRLSTIYAPEGYIIETLVNEATILSQVALSRRPPNVEDENGDIIERGADKEKLELFGGSLTVSKETLCPENVKKSDQPDVTLKEGRTTVTGLNFLYSNATGIGNMKGPITLDRVAEGDSPALNATSDTMQVNVDDDKTFLEGNVKVTSEDRVSEAASLEYNEERGLAILRGDLEEGIPAKSTKGNDVTQGDIIIYYLDTNDVLVEGNVQADIEVNLEDEETSGDGAADGADGASSERGTGE
jgi:lipopolysaccharide export system protein LptA